MKVSSVALVMGVIFGMISSACSTADSGGPAETGGSSGTGATAGTGGSSGAAAGTGGSSGAAAGTGGSSGAAAGTGGSSGAAAGTGGSSGAAAGTSGSAGSGGAAAGTGGSAGGGEGTAVTTLSGTTPVNALTPDEATKLCDDTFAYFGSAIPLAIACKWQGLAYAASSSAPTEEQLRTNCTSHEASCQDAGGANYNPSCSEIPSTCTATVAEYSDCITEEVAAFTETVTGLITCDVITRDATSAIFEAMAPTPPPSCESLSNACPDLYPPSPSSN